MKLANEWKDYELLDMASGMKLERWGKYVLSRPDPQIIWKEKTFKEKWKNLDAKYIRSNKGGGHWENVNSVPENWQIKYKDLTFSNFLCYPLLLEDGEYTHEQQVFLFYQK